MVITSGITFPIRFTGNLEEVIVCDLIVALGVAALGDAAELIVPDALYKYL